MIKKSLIPAACNPSTICSRIGFPRTLIIGLGRSAVISRIRVPRPAARRTALSILVITDVGVSGTVSRPDCQDGCDLSPLLPISPAGRDARGSGSEGTGVVHGRGLR